MTPPTERELRALALTLAVGMAEAAVIEGITHHGIRARLDSLYVRLGVMRKGRYGCAVDAARALGWLEVPNDLLHPRCA